MDRSPSASAPVRFEYAPDECRNDLRLSRSDRRRLGPRRKGRDPGGLEARRIEDWMTLQVRNVWPYAKSVGHENGDGSLHFSISSGSGYLQLTVDPSARALAVHELTKFLHEEHWLHRLQAERCLRVQWSGFRPSLVRPPDTHV